MSNITKFEFNNDAIREQDGLFSVYDIIRVIGGHKNPHQLWKGDAKERSTRQKGLVERYPEVLRKTDNLKFPGRGQRMTPVCDRQVALEIIGLLPGEVGKKYRQEVAKLFLRYVDADITLADEIIQRQTDPKALEWQKRRLDGKIIRTGLTNTLQEHDVTQPIEYAQCTNSIYKPVLGGTAKQVKQQKGLAKKESLRDNLSNVELMAVGLAEALATQEIEVKDLRGFKRCNQACNDAGNKVRKAIE